MEQLMVPPLILQPIVENAIKHGFSMTHDRLQIKVSIWLQGARVYYKLTNDGQPYSQANTAGLGLRNIQNRLETLFEEDQNFSINNVDGLVVVALSFPKID